MSYKYELKLFKDNIDFEINITIRINDYYIYYLIYLYIIFIN